MKTKGPRVAILISGSGSNMVALVDAMQAGCVDAEPVLVLSSEPEAAGLAKAAARGIATTVVDWRESGPDRAAHDARVAEALVAASADLVACAGYMRIMTAEFVVAWQGRMLNIHPSLLPAFKGLHTHKRALEAGCAIHGCSVHEVVPDLDAGPILGQAAVSVRGGDAPEALAARVLRQEHRLYPKVLSAFVKDPDAARRVPISLFDPAD